MAAVAWSVWYNEVLPWLPGCPTTMADVAIRRAVIELCDRALIWQTPLTAIDSVANQMTYSMSSGISNIGIAAIREVSFSGKQLVRKSPRQLSAIYRNQNWRAMTASAPEYFTEEQPGKLMLVPAPNAAIVGAISVVAALRPTEAASGIDDTNFDYWREYVRVVADGVLGYLKGQPRTPYYDPKGSAEHTQKFEDAIGAYNLLNSKGRGGNSDFHSVTHFV